MGHNLWMNEKIMATHKRAFKNHLVERTTTISLFPRNLVELGEDIFLGVVIIRLSKWSETSFGPLILSMTNGKGIRSIECGLHS